jgi:hypothetical protein
MSPVFLATTPNGRFLKDTVRTRFPNVSLDWLVEEGENSFTVIIDSLDSRERTFLSAKGSAEQMADATLPWDHICGDIFLLEYLLMGLAMDGTDSEYGTDARPDPSSCPAEGNAHGDRPCLPSRTGGLTDLS